MLSKKINSGSRNLPPGTIPASEFKFGATTGTGNTESLMKPPAAAIIPSLDGSTTGAGFKFGDTTTDKSSSLAQELKILKENFEADKAARQADKLKGLGESSYLHIEKT